MAIRDDTYEEFGPMLLEALIDTMLDEINFLRTALDLPLRTKEYFLGRSNNNQDHLELYDWMD